MNSFGIFLFLFIVIVIWRRYQSMERPFDFPLHGYCGAAILIAGQALTLAGMVPIATYFTAIAWTGYILWADAAVFALSGQSLLRTYPEEFVTIVLFSIPLWLIFEAYNLRLQNWIYVGLPRNALARDAGFIWAFATIWPAIFETAALLGGLRRSRRAGGAESKSRAGPGWLCAPVIQAASIAAGMVLLTAPLLLPAHLRPYGFGSVWLGFIFLVEPINYRIGAESLWKDWEQGQLSRQASLMLAGAVCGVFWEFWNFSAMARWVYVFPIFQNYKIFAMPLPGYLGFPAFALECFAMFAFLISCLNGALRRLGFRGRFRRAALEL